MSSWMNLNWTSVRLCEISVFEGENVLKRTWTNMWSFVGCGFFHSDWCFLCTVSSFRHEQQTLIIHLSETVFFCLMHPYQCLFKNRARWLEFNVRVIAWSIALIFVFEWSGCIAKRPITVVTETLPPHILSSLERHVGSIELGVSVGSPLVWIRHVSNVLHHRCKMTQDIHDGQNTWIHCRFSDSVVGFSLWEQWIEMDLFRLDSTT